MAIKLIRIVGLVVALALAGPGLADDCTEAAKTALLETAQRPISTTTTKMDAQGNPAVTRTIQTTDNKYVQLETGQWYSVNVSIKDSASDNVDYLKTVKLTCRRAGSDSVNGESSVVYELHLDDAGDLSDNKIWVSSKNLILKSEANVGGVRSSTIYDFSHVTAPSGAVPIGSK